MTWTMLAHADSCNREVNMPIALATIWKRPFEIHKEHYVTVISERMRKSVTAHYPKIAVCLHKKNNRTVIFYIFVKKIPWKD